MQIITDNSKRPQCILILSTRCNAFPPMHCILHQIATTAIHFPPIYCIVLNALYCILNALYCILQVALNALQTMCPGWHCLLHCARLNHLLIPSNLLQQPCTVLQLNMLHRQALQQLHCPLHCAAVATCCSALPLPGTAAAQVFLLEHLFSRPRTTHLRCTPLAVLIPTAMYIGLKVNRVLRG